MDIDIEHKEHITNKEINITNIDIDIRNLETSMRESSIKARKLFMNIKNLKACSEYSYTGISDTELDYIIEQMSNMNQKHRLKTEELTKTFSIIRRYMKNTEETSYKKDVYKANIKNILELLKKNVTHIQNYKIEEGNDIGHLYNYQIDHMRQLKQDIQRDYSNNKDCKEIRHVRILIEKYYKVICERIDYYTNELKRTNEKSSDHSDIMNKIYEYRLLYKRLILYIKHYKIINKEKLIICENKSENLDHLYQFLDKLEKCLKYKIDHIYNFIQNAK